MRLSLVASAGRAPPEAGRPLPADRVDNGSRSAGCSGRIAGAGRPPRAPSMEDDERDRLVAPVRDRKTQE
ncbi:hypothetical protein [Amycolatopsis speibonae]|uniref:Uncharacterized protein n=1 Tax=Amycolatopsis speibonae TaxID=1450224 RepID=A0ABV7P6U8_9PSEU